MHNFPTRKDTGIEPIGPLFLIMSGKIPCECRRMGKHWLTFCCQDLCPTSTHKTRTHNWWTSLSRANHHLGSNFREQGDTSHPSSPMICDSKFLASNMDCCPSKYTKVFHIMRRHHNSADKTFIQLTMPPKTVSFGLAWVYLRVSNIVSVLWKYWHSWTFQFADFGNWLAQISSNTKLFYIGCQAALAQILKPYGQ